MKDPVLNKLKDDAGLILNELLRAFAHRPAPNQQWQYARVKPAVPSVKSPTPASSAQSGLCYFHLN